MKVLMLGWEYPPHIAGGLGTACEGLTKALAWLGLKIKFVVPALYGSENAPHMELMSSEQLASKVEISKSRVDLEKIRLLTFLSPYQRPEEYIECKSSESIFTRLIGENSRQLSSKYDGSLFDHVISFSNQTIFASLQCDFDIIHAHDWMTFPAAVALKEKTQKPLVVHLHSLEFDRVGDAGNSMIIDAERLGLEKSDRVIAVSHYTKRMIEKHYSIDPNKIEVVHNGIYPKGERQSYRGNFTNKKIVLFLGRVTFQKGPDYFVEMAKRVIPNVPDVMFVMAGSGDMLSGLIEKVEHEGLSENFTFTGFLKGEEVENIFKLASLYVMPSVSEPFGLTALEAIACNTPVIMSKQSGVSEVIHNAFKVDFWDIEKMSDIVVNGLIHDELRADMITMAKTELERIRWDMSAEKVKNLYETLV